MYLRCSITERCNLRCRYCLPEGARFSDAALDTSGMVTGMAAISEAVPVEKIRITGGEPTLHPDCVALVAAAKHLAPCVGLTTNGTRLEPLLPALRDAGLDLLNISLDAAGEEGFRAMSRRDGFTAVLSAIRRAKALGFDPLKLNVVAMQSTDFAGLVDLARYEGLHIRFIELMAIGEARPWHDEAFIDAAAIRQRLFDAGHSLQPVPEADLPTSRVWHFNDLDPRQSTVGFITTVSAPFCETCDRIRFTSQGRLHTCLFDEIGHDLRPALERDDHRGLIEIIRAAVAGKAPPERFERRHRMAAIGG